MATPPKKPPKKPLYAKGTAPEMGKPPVVHRSSVSHVPYNVKPGDIIHHTQVGASHNIVERRGFRERYNKSLEDSTRSPKQLEEGLNRVKKIQNNIDSGMTYHKLGRDKRRLGDLAAEEYKATGKTGGAMSSLAARGVRQLNKNQNNLLKVLPNLRAGEASMDMKAANLETTLKSGVVSKPKMRRAAALTQRATASQVLQFEVNEHTPDKAFKPFSTTGNEHTFKNALRAGNSLTESALSAIKKALEKISGGPDVGGKPIRRGGGAGGPPKHRRL